MGWLRGVQLDSGDSAHAKFNAELANLQSKAVNTSSPMSNTGMHKKYCTLNSRKLFPSINKRKLRLGFDLIGHFSFAGGKVSLIRQMKRPAVFKPFLLLLTLFILMQSCGSFAIIFYAVNVFKGKKHFWPILERLRWNESKNL